MPPTASDAARTAYRASLDTWRVAGYPKAPPTTSTTGSSPRPFPFTQTSRTLEGDFNVNTSGTGGSYGFLWGTTNPPADIGANRITTPSQTGTSSGGQSMTLSSLVCGQTYYFRSRVTNGGDTVLGSPVLNFNIACTPPVISGSTATVVMSEDNSPTPFVAPNLSVVDDDAGTLTWSVSSQPVIQGTATAAGSASASGTDNAESISYTPPLDFVGIVEFTVQVTNAVTTLSDVHTITVNVNAEDDPPQFKDSPAGAVIVSDSLTVSEGNGSTPSQTINLYAEDADGDPLAWSVFTAPSSGSLSAFGSASPSTTNSITYTPDDNVDQNDSFVIQVFDGTSQIYLTVDAMVTPQPDNPVAVGDGPVIFDVGVAVTIPVLTNDSDVDTGDAITVNSISNLTAGASAIAVSGNTEIQYTSSMTQFTDDTFQYQAIDNSASTLTSNLATVTMRPRDTDNDGVIDYLDNCAFTSNASQLDFDNDQVINVNTTSDPGGNVGGDACDLDDDNDGMPDSFEDANGFDQFNSADAIEDADGDGISNLQEFLDNTNPTEANVAIDATGYLTPYDLNLVPPVPTDIHLDATAVTAIFAKRPTDQANPYGPYRPGDNTITWRASNDTSTDLIFSDPGGKVSDPPERPFFIRPLVSFDVDQQVEENGLATVTVRLNGDAPTWEAKPIGSVTVDYSVSGTASNPSDHDAVSGTLTFVVGDYEEAITFNVIADGVVDPNETIVLQLANATNAVIGSKQTHTATIVEDNIAPRAALQFSQGGSAVGATFDNSPITIDAMPSDANGAQALSCNWSGTDNALMPPAIVADCKASPNWTVISPVAGNYRIEVVVTDNGSPAQSTRVSRILHVAVPPVEMLSAANDSDMDGIDDLTEGYADLDGDGIPAYLDDIDGTVAGANLIPDQTVDMSQLLLLETEPGLTLRRGSTTQAANIFGALVSDSDVAQSGGQSGGAPLNSADSFEHVGGIYDFEIDGMIPGSSVNIVIPLQSAIPQDARYRKFNSATGWSDFVVDANNSIASASGELGACPEPGSSAYSSGLNYLDNCIQLTIQDGGLNDTDNSANGVINDPSTVGVELRDPEGFDEVEDGSGGGRMSPLMLTILLVFGGFAFWRRRRGFGID